MGLHEHVAYAALRLGHFSCLPEACGVGFILAPLRGLEPSVHYAIQCFTRRVTLLLQFVASSAIEPHCSAIPDYGSNPALFITGPQSFLLPAGKP